MEKENRVVLITGATAGFGAATARIFAKNGYDLIITGRRKERLDQLAHELSQEVKVLPLVFDVRFEEDVIETLGTIPSDWKSRIHFLINNAGLALGKESIELGDSADWNGMIDTNVKGLLYVSQQIIPVLKKNQAGHIFNISSIAGKEVYPEGGVYCASKHAVEALSKAMRVDLVKHNIKVTNISPGAANTEFSTVRFKGDKNKADATYLGFEPLVAQDIAETIYFVATRPAHVSIHDLTIMPSAQASATIFHKN